jgi:hypothetical protein
MLLDIRKEAESIYSLVAWLEQQPKTKTYEYRDCLRCPLTLYFAVKFGRPMYVDDSHYGEVVSVQPLHVRLRALPQHFDRIAHGSGAKSWTYGKMLARARWVAQ